ncbi:hypothetical protein [Tengunoibacter tsumagoiensis]|uniref:Uncharacterized protein n=1 Tax=Tengunoibacter tsumagoiensis TaxID=2014871 RepID=A0A402A2T0_9CHLR|nr:hypothetical protein [Tengunoibacter tsumagoiensis]GCE13434.1 hypothetical protein KTT_32930 [Tengunoibacter tsumagoiensis]
MKTISTGLFIGAIIALFILIIGSFGIFMFGVTHPPQHIHLSLFSQGFFDFTSTSATKFEMAVNPQGILSLVIFIMVLVAILFGILKRLFHSTPAQ